MPSNLGRIVGSRILSGTATTSADMKSAFQYQTGRKALDGDIYISTTDKCIYQYSDSSDLFTVKVNIASMCSGVEIIGTGQLSYIPYSKLQNYQIVIAYGFKDGIASPNQFCFCFIPDQLQVRNADADLQVVAMAGSANWTYPLRIQRKENGNVYWYSGEAYSGNTTFYVTKIVGVR